MEALGQKEEAVALCVALYPQVFSAIALYVGDRLLAEDLAQETMLRLWRERSRVTEMDIPPDSGHSTDIATRRTSARGCSNDRPRGDRTLRRQSSRSRLGRAALGLFHHRGMSGLVEADLAASRKPDLRQRSPTSFLNLGTLHALCHKRAHLRYEVVAHEVQL
jgi:hypothetical protein